MNEEHPVDRIRREYQEAVNYLAIKAVLDADEWAREYARNPPFVLLDADHEEEKNSGLERE